MKYNRNDIDIVAHQTVVVNGYNCIVRRVRDFDVLVEYPNGQCSGVSYDKLVEENPDLVICYDDSEPIIGDGGWYDDDEDDY